MNTADVVFSIDIFLCMLNGKNNTKMNTAAFWSKKMALCLIDSGENSHRGEI